MSLKQSTQPKDNHAQHVDFTVHQFTVDSASRRQPLQNDILNEADRLLKAAILDSSGWKDARATKTDAQRGERAIQFGNVFVYNSAPPIVVPSETRFATYAYKEWGTAVSDDEIFTLADLEDFQHCRRPQFTGSSDKLEDQAQLDKLEVCLPRPRSECRYANEDAQVNASTSFISNDISHAVVSIGLNSLSLGHPLLAKNDIINLKNSEDIQTIEEKDCTGSKDKLQSQARNKHERESTQVQEPVSNLQAQAQAQLDKLEECLPRLRSEYANEEAQLKLSTTNNMSHVIVSFPSNSASFAQDAHHPLPSNHEVVNLEKSEGSQIIDGKESTGSQDNLQSQAQHKRERECTPVQEPISKRRKLVIEPLYNALPKPHIHPSPFFSSKPTLKGRPFKKTAPTFIAPYTAFSHSDDNRVAWLIPVRGVLPWDGCTSGNLLDSSTGMSPPSEANEVLWTRASLLRFWEYLLGLCSSGSQGALGISFQVSKQANPASDVTSEIDQSLATTLTARIAISSVDYIKVYHDARASLYLRNAIDAWSFQVVDDGGTQKWRMLKGAKLVLVDESSQGILVL